MMQLTANTASLIDFAVSSCGSDPFQPIFDVLGAIGWLLVVGLLLTRRHAAAHGEHRANRQAATRKAAATAPRPAPAHAPTRLRLVKDRPRGLLPQLDTRAM